MRQSNVTLKYGKASNRCRCRCRYTSIWLSEHACACENLHSHDNKLSLIFFCRWDGVGDGTCHIMQAPLPDAHTHTHIYIHGQRMELGTESCAAFHNIFISIWEPPLSLRCLLVLPIPRFSSAERWSPDRASSRYFPHCLSYTHVSIRIHTLAIGAWDTRSCGYNVSIEPEPPCLAHRRGPCLTLRFKIAAH